jgi:HSP20 family protein
MTVFPSVSRRFPPAKVRDDFTSWIDKFFEEGAAGWPATAANGDLVPALNVAEDEKSLTVTVELPGFDEKDLQVTTTKSLLTVSGERKWEEEKKGKHWHRVESRFGSFSRSLSLPENLKTDQVDAVFEKGVLTLSFPKADPTPTTKVKIKAQ